MTITAIDPRNQPAVDDIVLALAAYESALMNAYILGGELAETMKKSGKAVIFDKIPNPNDLSYNAPSLPCPETTGFAPFVHLETLEYLGESMGGLGTAAGKAADAHNAVRYQYCKHGIIPDAGGGK